MRFAVAATVLANTLPATFQSNGIVVVEAREERRELLQSLARVPAADRPEAAKQAIAARRRKLGRGGMLKNFASSKNVAASAVECDPDVGVLACGFGQYCDGSLESSLGGVCVSASLFASDGFHPQRNLQASSIPTASPSASSGAPISSPTATATGSPTFSPIASAMTPPPTVADTGLPTFAPIASAMTPPPTVTDTGSPTASPIDTTLGPPTNATYTISGPGVYCDPDSPYFGGLECDCESWALENSTGTIECKLVPETCVEGCDETCYSIDFYYSMDGSTSFYQYCYEFVSPFEQSFCFGYQNDQTCKISLDGNECSSCYSSYRLNCDFGTCYTEACSNFDCENAGLGVGTSCDDAIIPPAYFACFLDLNGRYPSCSICPDDTIAYPEVYFDLPGYGSFNCSYIADIATYGGLNPQQCTYAGVLAADACCEGADGPVYVCNVCGVEGHVVTNLDALINIPGQPSVSCQDFQAFAAEGQIVEAQCGIVQGFVAQTCGCTAPDGMTPTSSPVAGSLPTSSLNPGPSAAESEQSSNSGSSSTLLAPSSVFVMVLSTIATMTFSFLTE